jgi:hypothetical protein
MGFSAACSARHVLERRPFTCRPQRQLFNQMRKSYPRNALEARILQRCILRKQPPLHNSAEFANLSITAD